MLQEGLDDLSPVTGRPADRREFTRLEVAPPNSLLTAALDARSATRASGRAVASSGGASAEGTDLSLRAPRPSRRHPRSEGAAQRPVPWPSDDRGPEFVELSGSSAAARMYSSVEAAMLMSLLPHEKWSYSYIRDEDHGEGDAECRVCLCDYEVGEDIVRLPCMHYAHTQCVEAWLLRSPRCPVCRTSVREV